MGFGGGGSAKVTAAAIEATFAAAGQLYAGTGAGTGEQFAIGTAGQVLRIGGADPSGLEWSSLAAFGVSSFDGRMGAVVFSLADAETVFTAAGDLLVGTGAGTGAILPIGSSGNVLTVSGGTAAWAAPSGGGVSSFNTRTGAVVFSLADAETVFVAAGDLLHGTGSGTGAILSIGATNTVLRVAGGEPTWATDVISFNTRTGAITFTLADAETVFVAAGDLLHGTGSGTGAILGIGTTGQVLTVVGGEPAWATGSNPEAITTLSGTSPTLSNNGNTLLLSGATTATMPTATAGAFCWIMVKQAAGGGDTIAFTGVVWPGGTAPVMTATASHYDRYDFFCADGSVWHGVITGQNYAT